MSMPEMSGDNFSQIQEAEIQEVVWDNPLAVITYASSTKAIIIDKDEMGLFRQTTHSIPASQDFGEVEGRVRRLDNFSDVEVRQVQLSQGIPNAHKSITGVDYISFRYFYDSPQGGESDLVEGEDILNFLTDNSGGILVFEGQEKPQDLAVFFDRVDEPKATVLFFHPDYTQAGLDSFAGFEAFFRSLNIEISQLIGNPDLREYLKEFDKEIIEGDTHHDLTAVLEVFRARVVASLYLYETTHDKRYMQFPLSQFRNGKLDIFDVNNTDPQEALNELLWDDQITVRPVEKVSLTPAQLTEADKKVILSLSTQAGKRLREAVSSPTSIYSFDVMAAYLTKVYELIRSHSSKAHDDAIRLMRELQESPLQNRDFYFKVGKKKVQLSESEYGISSDYYQRGNLGELISELNLKLRSIQDEIRYNNILQELS